MQGEVRAVVDIGTNSVKLLVGEVRGGSVMPLHEGSHQTRLGEGFYETHVLQPKAVEHTARAVADFVNEARAWDPASIKVIATSAARDAVNKEELIRALEGCGVPVTIISGEQEADWAYEGVISDAQLRDRNLLVMDVGGGSTEFILGRGPRRVFAESFQLGSVRLLHRIALSDPPEEAELRECERQAQEVIQTMVKPHLEPEISAIGEVQLVGTGGTSTILARIEHRIRSFNRELIEGTFLSRKQVESEKIRLWTTTLEDRKKIIGLPANRADVILPGVVIFDQVMQALALPTLRISTRGLRFAALMHEDSH